MADDDQLGYDQVLQRIGELAEDLTAHPDAAVAGAVTELLDWIDAFHREGLGELISMVRAWRGDIFLENAAKDPVVGPFLATYGLAGLDEGAGEAVAAALAEVRPLIESHGGSVEVESIEDGVVKLRLAGTCDGCPSSSATLTYGVEAALREHWVNFRRLEVVDPATEIDPAKADLTCVTAPPGRPPAPPGAAPEQFIQIRPHKPK
jgi:Fe-S cluster biogenesis protein NfuA